MTTGRIKSIGILVATLILGILLGLLIPGIFHKIGGHRGKDKGHERDKEHKGDWFNHTLDKIIEPDSVQKEKIKPVALWASARLDSVERSANAQASEILDSVKNQLHPLLTEKQWKKLEKFDQQAKTNWGRHEKGH